MAMFSGLFFFFVRSQSCSCKARGKDRRCACVSVDFLERKNKVINGLALACLYYLYSYGLLFLSLLSLAFFFFTCFAVVRRSPIQLWGLTVWMKNGRTGFNGSKKRNI